MKKFERISISIQPKFRKEIKEAAERVNLSVSRYVVNSALKEARKNGSGLLG